MLRLNPTQLRLDARDLTWHIDHHNERQALHATGSSANVIDKTRSPKKKQHHARSLYSPYSFPHPPVGQETEAIDNHDDSIISNESVPHDSRSFWDSVLADAGTPTRTQTSALGNATVIEPSDGFLEDHRSSRASIEEDHMNWQDDNDDGAHHSDDLRSPFRDTEADVSSQWPIPSPFGSFDSTRVDLSIPAKNSDEDKVLPLDKILKTASAKRRLSFNNFNFFRRKVTPDLDGSLENNDHHSNASRDSDGRYQSDWSHHRSRSQSSTSSAGGDLCDGMYGSRRDRRTISTNLETYVNDRSDADGTGSAQLSNDAASRSMLPTVPMPRQLADIPRHASGLPRSSLYISQAAMSSSPHKGLDTTIGYSKTPVSERLLAFPPRRRKRYKPRSESFPFVSSEDPDMSTPPQLDGTSTFQSAYADLPSLTVSYPSTHDIVPTPPLGTPVWSYQSDSVSPAETPDHERSTNHGGVRGQAQTSHGWSSPHDLNQDPVEVRSYRSLSSMGSHHDRTGPSHSQIGTIDPSPSRRDLSPFAESFVPRSARRHASPQLPLPPPFSATPRNLSWNSVLLSSSVSPQTPPFRLPSSSISPVPRSNAHIPIYNDDLSPTTQPQTPAELPRSRRWHLATQNPLNTAPARPQDPSVRNDRLANWQAFGTPTRRSSARTRYFRDFEQENVGAVGVEERQLRRERDTGLRMGREEMERHMQR